MEKHKPLDESLKANGELLRLFPEMRRGKENNWENDAKLFSRLQEEQEELLQDFNLDLDDENASID